MDNHAAGDKPLRPSPDRDRVVPVLDVQLGAGWADKMRLSAEVREL